MVQSMQWNLMTVNSISVYGSTNLIPSDNPDGEFELKLKRHMALKMIKISKAGKLKKDGNPQQNST